MPDYKTCVDCGKEKPLSDFYTRSGLPHLRLAWCKPCHVKRARKQKVVPRHVSTVESETRLIEYLWRLGIPAMPGKAMAHEYADVVAWGCVMIEVKSSRYGGHSYNFNFTPLQQTRGLRGHVLVLATIDDDNEYQFHFFRSSLATFVFDELGLKSGVSYTPARTPRGKASVLTEEMMMAAKDRTPIIDDVRDEICEALRNGGKLEFKSNRRQKKTETA